MAVFLAWLWCSTLSGIGLPLFIKLCERPEASVAWPLSEERFGVCLSPPWCSLTRWTGMRLGMAWLDIFSKVSTRTVGVIAKLSFLEGERLGLLMYSWFPRREQARRSVPSPCLWPACLRLLRWLSWWRIQQVPLYTFGYPPMTSWARWTNRIGVVLHSL